MEGATAPRAGAGGGWSGEVGQDGRHAGTADNRMAARRVGTYAEPGDACRTSCPEYDHLRSNQELEGYSEVLQQRECVPAAMSVPGDRQTCS